jgi:polyribonucleotide nucleotidyltransferase
MMKLIRLLTLALTIFLVTPAVMAQQDGELNRFANTSISEENKVSIYPNPAIEYIQVKIENSSLQDPQVLLYNIIGNPVEVQIKVTDEDTYQIDIKELPTGYYFVAIKDENSYFRETYKFVKR